MLHIDNIKKAFRNYLHVGSKVGKVSELQVTETTLNFGITFMWILGWAKCLNYKSQRQHLKAFRN